jgi:response regulator of citrate/malate metabolism
MIKVLVIDDDFRVAQIHADRVGRVPGFVCVGTAKNTAEARRAIAEQAPDLLLLDIYLPGEDGLSLLRSLSTVENGPDCIVVTAARDIATVRAAMRGGAIYYLVKPFGFEQLRQQLESYRKWRTRLSGVGAVDQAGVDRLYGLLHSAAGDGARSKLHPTMQKVLSEVQSAGEPIGAAEVAAHLGMSRPTAQRYLTELERRGLVDLRLEYGSTGRPVNSYVQRNTV